MKARTCSVHTVLVLVGHARLVVLRPPAAALALAGVLLVHALLLLDPVVVLVEVEASEVVRVHVVRVDVQRHVVIERRAAAVRRDHRHVLQHVVHHLLDLLHLVSHELPWSKVERRVIRTVARRAASWRAPTAGSAVAHTGPPALAAPANAPWPCAQ